MKCIWSSFVDGAGIRRTPHGVRGLKFLSAHPPPGDRSRTPHGVRGLKCLGRAAGRVDGRSHPARGAWIEIGGMLVLYISVTVAPRTGCVD